MPIQVNLKPPIGDPFHAVDQSKMQIAYADYLHMVKKYVYVSSLLDQILASAPTNPYPSWCCQVCGENIGWLGRVLPLHKCPKRISNHDQKKA